VAAVVVIAVLIGAGAFFVLFPPKTTDTVDQDPGYPTGSIYSVLSGTNITLGSSVTDSLTVTGKGSGTPAPTGTATFQVRVGSGTWTTYDTEMLTASGGNGIARSEYLPLAAATYNLRAAYSGDNTYASWQGGDTGTTLTVHPGHITAPVTTVLSKTAINLGESISDSVNVPGLGPDLPAPTGTVDLQVRIGSGPWTSYDNETLTALGGNGTATSREYRPMTLNSYDFRAMYLGDANYLPVQSGDTEEPLTIYVGLYAAPVTTALSQSSIAIGNSVTDSVTVRGMGAGFPVPSGTVQFQMLTGGTWTTYDNETLTSNGFNGSATSVPFAPSTSGSFEFRAAYQGDDNYLAGQSGDGAEPLVVHSDFYTSSVDAILSRNAIDLGHNITDSVTVRGMGAGFPVPSGTVQFQVKSGSGSWTTYDTRDLSGRGTAGAATSAPYTPLKVGTLYLRAVYLGDANYLTSRSGDGAEPLTVGKVLTYTETKLGVNTIDLGRSVRDNVTVYGINGSSVIPTGTVSFQVKNGTGPWVIYDANVPLVNRTAISSWYTPTNAAGDFKFQALYDGDWNYNASHSCPWSEPLNVLVAPSGSAVSLIVVGQSATAGITVSGLGEGYPTPTGTVSFQIKYGGGEWAPLGPDVTLEDGRAISSLYTPPGAGSFVIQAIYGGDTNYSGSWASVTY
jgi:Bacterial Ig-like domain (group 3)